MAPPASTSAMHGAQGYNDGNAALDCSKATLQQAAAAAAAVVPTSPSTTSSVGVAQVTISDPKKRKKISYAIEDLLKKDDDS